MCVKRGSRVLGKPVCKIKLREKTHEIVEYIRDKGIVSISELALETGYARHYFKYHILPLILDINEDIVRIKKNGIEYLAINKEKQNKEGV